MNEPRIVLTRLELVQKFFLGMRVALSRRRSTEADLLSERTSEAADRKREAALRSLAEHLAYDFDISKHEVTRPALDGESEMILTRLRDANARREQGEPR